MRLKLVDCSSRELILCVPDLVFENYVYGILWVLW